MQVFKAFYKSLRRQITSVLLYVIAFAAISVIMANTMSENTDTLFTAKRLTVAVFDHDNTDESRVLYNYLDRTQNLTSIKDDNEAIADELFFRNVDYVLTHCAPTDLQRKIQAVTGDDTHPVNELTDFLQRVYDECEFRSWFCGHYHRPMKVEEGFHVLYENIVPLTRCDPVGIDGDIG